MTVPYLFDHEFRDAIDDARAFVDGGLSALLASPDRTSADAFVSAYEARETGLRARVGPVPLLVALAALRSTDVADLRWLLSVGHPAAEAALNLAGFGPNDELALGDDDAASGSRWVENNRVAHATLLAGLYDTSSEPERFTAQIATGEFALLQDGGLTTALAHLPDGAAVSFLGRPSTYSGGPDLECFLAHLSADRVRPGLEVMDDRGPRRNGWSVEAVRALVTRRVIEVGLLQAQLDVPHLALIRNTLLVVQQHHGVRDSAAIVRLNRPAPPIYAFVAGFLHALARSATPVLPTQHLSLTLPEVPEPRPSVSCSCGGSLSYGRFSHRTTSRRGDPIQVDAVDGYRCSSCGLILFEPDVARDLNGAIRDATAA